MSFTGPSNSVEKAPVPKKPKHTTVVKDSKKPKDAGPSTETAEVSGFSPNRQSNNPLRIKKFRVGNDFH